MSDILTRKPWNDGRDGDWINEAAAEIKRLTRELAEARAQTRQAVREALADALRIVVCESEGDLDFAAFKMRAMIARFDAEGTEVMVSVPRELLRQVIEQAEADSYAVESEFCSSDEECAEYGRERDRLALLRARLDAEEPK